ncbi:MAG TPA: carbohydrate kinase [Defluviitoga tunisiensis]|nr:carbohydrate kinase [Defluviitoga tunisiensis]
MAILCAGEILYDFISQSPNKGLGETKIFEKRPGGSPFNVAVGLAKLGADVSFLSKIGSDEFGKSLLKYIKENHINTDCIISQNGCKTTLAFAAVDKYGKAEYEFYRDHAADVNLKMEDLNNLQLDKFSIFHFGSIALLENPTSLTLKSLFEEFVSKKKITSFDPNIRKSMIKNEEIYLRLINQIIKKVDILKLSDDDLYYITKEKNVEKAVSSLNVKDGCGIFLTLGSEGSMVFKDNKFEFVPAYKVNVVDTVGCGDSFMASILYKLKDYSYNELKNISFSALRDYADFANKCAAIVASKPGAADAMPSLEEVINFF